jgi:hypothetical protein
MTVRIALSVPATNERGPLFMDQALAAIHQANPHRLPVCLELGYCGDSISLACQFPPELRAIIEGQLLAQYPECSLRSLTEDEPLSTDRCLWITELRLYPDLFPIRRYGQFEDALNRLTADPLTALLTTLARGQRGALSPRVEIILWRARPARRRRAIRCLQNLALPFFRAHHRLAHLYLHLALAKNPLLRMGAWFLSRLAPHPTPHQGETLHTSTSHAHEREEDLQAAADKLNKQLFEAQIRLIVSGPPAAGGAATAKLREIAGAFGIFSVPRLGAFHTTTIRCVRIPPRRFRGHPFLLSTEEVATLWHLPTLTVRAPTMATVESREFEPPVTLPRLCAHPDLAVLGVTAFRRQRERFGILPEDRLRHLAILGKTGMGKSTLLQSLLLSDIAAGRGVAIIDPHGDLAESLLPAIPKQRTNDVVLFDAGDLTHPLAFNPLACPEAARRPLVASGIVSAFKKLYGDSWGPRLEHILRNALLALLEVPGTSLVSVLRLLSEARYRQAIIARLSDPVVRAFWEREFAGMHPKLQTEAIAPIQNKVGAFVSSPLLRNILGQSQGRFDVRAVMDEGRVLIVNLSKGRIGEDASTLLGSLLITSLQVAAMGRAEMPEEKRRPFHLYVDEFQNFATDSFATILSEARKYRLSLTLANQYLDQLEERTAAALFGNVGSLLVFQVGARDAEALAEQLGGEVMPQDLMRLPRYQAYARLLIDGQPSRPFSMRTLPPQPHRLDERRAAIIRRTSRQRYGRPSAHVEREIQAAFA